MANGTRLTYVSPHRCVGLEERVVMLERDIAYMVLEQASERLNHLEAEVRELRVEMDRRFDSLSRRMIFVGLWATILNDTTAVAGPSLATPP